MSPYNRSAILYFLLCHQSSTYTKRDHSANSAEYQDPETGIALGVPTSPVLVGPCHHGMARPQVADRGTASDKEGSCE